MNDSQTLRAQLEQALALHQAGDLGTAARLYRDVLTRWPEQPDALYRLGLIALQSRNAGLALQLFDEALKYVPDFSGAHHHRALALRLLGRPAEAQTAAQTATRYDAQNAEAWDLAGCLLRDLQQMTDARAAHERAIALQPANGSFYNNYAITLAKTGDYPKAHDMALQATQLQPGAALPLMTLGHIYGESGYPLRAIECYRRIDRENPAYAEAAQAAGRAHLLVGDMRQGWDLLEHRPFMTHCNARLAPLCRWRGEPIRHLLVVAEQGHGDSLMLLRYLNLLGARVAKITFVAPLPLQRLMHSNFPAIDIVGPDDPWPDADAFELMMSLPRQCDTQLETIPVNFPLKAAAEDVKDWEQRLASIPHPRIGLIWSGNPVNSVNHRRSLNFEQLTPLVGVARPHLVSLQCGPGHIDLAPHGIFDAAPWLNDFADTAGAISQLDVVIAMCTGPMHLAAAMDKPVMLMLGFEADWRWLLEREDSPWYPSVKIYRQAASFDWDPVVTRITQDVARVIDGDTGVLVPTRWQHPAAQVHSRALPLP